MKKYVFLLMPLFAAFFSCAGPQFLYDYDPQVDFSELKTYAFYEDMNTGLSDLDADRVAVAIDSVLTEQGLAEVLEPDFKINFYASYFKEPSRSSIGLGVGGGGSGLGIGVSGGIPMGGPTVYMRLTIEFVEWPSNILYWQTVIESKMDPNKKPAERDAYFYELINEALQKYPPEIN